MTDVALLLGPIVFQDFEVPSGINFGGRQRLALHRLPSGSRVIDALGRDDAQISFSGIFAGSDAILRARSLDELRVAGIPLPLTWDVLFYTVLISDFCADYRSSWWNSLSHRLHRDPGRGISTLAGGCFARDRCVDRCRHRR